MEIQLHHNSKGVIVTDDIRTALENIQKDWRYWKMSFECGNIEYRFFRNENGVWRNRPTRVIVEEPYVSDAIPHNVKNVLTRTGFIV